MPKMLNLASFWKPEACCQTVLPDRSVLIGQTLVENAKIQKFKCDNLSNFQTMWSSESCSAYFFKPWRHVGNFTWCHHHNGTSLLFHMLLLCCQRVGREQQTFLFTTYLPPICLSEAIKVCLQCSQGSHIHKKSCSQLLAAGGRAEAIWREEKCFHICSCVHDK